MTPRQCEVFIWDGINTVSPCVCVCVCQPVWGFLLEGTEGIGQKVYT